MKTRSVFLLIIVFLFGCGGESEESEATPIPQEPPIEISYQTKCLSMYVSHISQNYLDYVYLDDFYALVYTPGKDVQRVEFKGNGFSNDRVSVVKDEIATVDIYIFGSFAQSYYVTYGEWDSFNITFIELHGTINIEEFKYSDILSMDACHN